MDICTVIYRVMIKEVINIWFFEVSWETCNKVGGINTVLKSKSRFVKEHYGEKYCLVGPYFIKKAYGEFVEKAPVDGLKKAFEILALQGIKCHYGNWVIDGEPNTILVDFSDFIKNTNEIKKELWDWYRIDSLGTEYFDFDEPTVWGYAVGKLIEEISRQFADEKIVAQFHEWLAGSALLYLKHKKARVGTVFTTHATILGRTIASNAELYSVLDKINPEQEAYHYKIQAKFLAERAAAKNSDVFTTVSEITGMEAEKLLGRKPDVILCNGLDIGKFPSFEDASINHKLFKQNIREFIMYYFFPYYNFDLDETLIYFLCGRYEFHDKGIDVFIKALGNVNEQLKKENSRKTIVAFFWVPGNVKGIKPELLENKNFYLDIKESIIDEMTDIKIKLIYNSVIGKDFGKRDLIKEETLAELKQKLLRFGKKGQPALSTHDLFNEENDEILTSFKKCNLLNRKEDRVKVIFYSIYLTGADGLLDTSYYESMMGSHLGVFPSYYEPWGYTPLEGAALGVASITTDLSGFGRYIEKTLHQTKAPGVFVLPRLNKMDREVTEELATTLYNYSQLPREERIANKIAAREIAKLADWSILIKNYFRAHEMAAKKID